MCKFVWRVIRLLLVAYLGGMLLFFLMQRFFIYVPQKGTESELLAKAKWNGLAAWRDAGGRLLGWQTLDGDAAKPILIVHGNAGYAMDRTYLVHYLRQAQPTAPGKIFLLEYPGYGSRAGTPGQEVMTQAGVEAVTLLQNPLLIGESIGTGIACQIAHRAPDNVRGMILITPFDSLVSVGRHHYPWLPVRWLITDRMDSSAALKNYPGPVSFVVAERDDITPATLGLALYDGYSGTKRLWLVPDCGHNEVTSALTRADWRGVLEFASGNR